MAEFLREKPMRLLWLPILVVAIFYAPGFGGFWHGDDVANLNRAWMLTQQGTLWPDTLRLFIQPVPSEGAFYRPMMLLSIALNYAFADAQYGGWYLVNLAVHLLNTFLIALLIRRIATRLDCDATISAPLAALLFGLCPAIAEGVYWMSARADGWVTLLTLTGVYCWADTKASRLSLAAIAMPLLLIAALGFKESAAVLSLQMVLLAVAWPGPLSRSQRRAIFAAFIIVGLFLAWRTYLFGNAWQVYAPVAGSAVAMPDRIWNSLSSLVPWWTALTQAAPVMSVIYVGTVALALMLAAMSRPLPQWRLGIALAGASGGLAFATLLNLGSMSVLGEGGRLSYGPVAWLVIAAGVFMSKPYSHSVHPPYWRLAATLALTLTVISGSVVLWRQLGEAWAKQASMRTLTQAVPAWAASHPGLTMLLVPDHDGAVVMARNAQGGMVLEPIQQQPYLHRVLPTLASEIQLRQGQFCNGMAQRLEIVRPRFADARTLAAIAEHADPGWPTHLACWSKSQQKIVPLSTPPMDASCETWLAAIRANVENCER